MGVIMDECVNGWLCEWMGVRMDECENGWV